MADRVETRRANRITVTFPVRVKFLKLCRAAAIEAGTGNKLHRDVLVKMRDEVKEKVDSTDIDTLTRKLFTYLGFRDRDATLLQVFDRAIERVDEIQGEWLHYSDFNFYDTRLESRWPWMRSGAVGAALVIFGFFLFTPILFCGIIKDSQVCPEDPTGRDRPYYGWLTAVYFASTTMSTVGYGDVTVSKNTRWSIFIGSVYMLLALVVAITAFSAAAEHAFQRTLSPLNEMTEKLLLKLTGKHEEKQLLYQHIRKIKFIKITEILVQVSSFVCFSWFRLCRTTLSHKPILL